jgi:hypothetical protein
MVYSGVRTARNEIRSEFEYGYIVSNWHMENDAPVIFPERDRLESVAPNGAKFPYGLNQNNEDNVHGEILISNADELYSEMPL